MGPDCVNAGTDFVNVGGDSIHVEGDSVNAEGDSNRLGLIMSSGERFRTYPYRTSNVEHIETKILRATKSPIACSLCFYRKQSTRKQPIKS